MSPRESYTTALRYTLCPSRPPSIMVCRSWTLEQTLFKTSLPTLTVNQVDESDLADYPLDALIAVSDDDLGVACIQGSKGILTHIAFATPTRILCIRMATVAPSKAKKKGKQAGIDSSRRPQGREILSSMLFNDREHRKVAFDMDKIAMALYHDFGLTIMKAVDLQSIRPGDRRAIGTLMFFLGGEREVHKQAVHDTFIGAGFEDGDVKSLALRAWAACRVSALPGLASRLQSAALIDTTVIPKRHLKLLARFTRTAWRLHALKPTRVKNDVQPEFTKLSGTLQLNQTRFKTRMRSCSSQVLTHGRWLV
ncbi:hypothetical protein DAEQUDRAFT_424500 [Daedalea quercina L-15889]|uniref:3'-5' exonuclease domain-containing protein n=1 Tax=Daedalea quercina L-15889 TaxID=1314783 RepID=A0A165TN43_9APHY|nr:hypothetical protein DAEQUDRAFT_424500 [Daedalea quercina L-15889]